MSAISHSFQISLFGGIDNYIFFFVHHQLIIMIGFIQSLSFKFCRGLYLFSKLSVMALAIMKIKNNVVKGIENLVAIIPCRTVTFTSSIKKSNIFFRFIQSLSFKFCHGLLFLS